MAFDITKLNPIGGNSSRGEAPVVWSYTTEDTLAQQDSSGYFNTASTKLSVGDIIESVVTSSSVPVTYGKFIVQANASGVVDVFDAINVPVTLSDSD